MVKSIEDQITEAVANTDWNALGRILKHLAGVKAQRDIASTEDIQGRAMHMLRALPLSFGVICNRMRKYHVDDVRVALDALVSDGRLMRIEWKHPMNKNTVTAYGPTDDATQRKAQDLQHANAKENHGKDQH